MYAPDNINNVDLYKFVISEDDLTRSNIDVTGESMKTAVAKIAALNENTCEQFLIIKQQEKIEQLQQENADLRGIIAWTKLQSRADPAKAKLRQENAELREELAKLQLDNHNLVADTYRPKQLLEEQPPEQGCIFVTGEPQPPETMQWISVDKHLPKDSEGVLMYLSTGAIYSGRGEVLKNTNASEEPRVGTRPKYTHWMPLPAAPQEQREGE